MQPILGFSLENPCCDMPFTDSDNHGYGTDVCLHYTLNDIMVQITQVYIFAFVIQWRLVLL